MLERWFLSHPRSVAETYLEHQFAALWFAAQLFTAGLACFVHALVPGLFQNTGSTMVARLHERMVKKRIRGAQEIKHAPPSIGAEDFIRRADAPRLVGPVEPGHDKWWN